MQPTAQLTVIKILRLWNITVRFFCINAMNFIISYIPVCTVIPHRGIIHHYLRPAIRAEHRCALLRIHEKRNPTARTLRRLHLHLNIPLPY